MKIGGEKVTGINVKTVKFYRGQKEYTLKVCPPSMGLAESIAPYLTSPTPPTKPMIKANGLPAVGADGKVIQEADMDDPGFQAAMLQVYKRKLAVELKDALREDAEVTVQTVEPEVFSKDSFTEYADSLWAEIVEAGFTEAELTHILEASQELALVVNVDDAVDGFLPSQA